LQSSKGFVAHFYAVSETVSPMLAWGFLGPEGPLKDMCYFFKARSKFTPLQTELDSFIDSHDFQCFVISISILVPLLGREEGQLYVENLLH